MIPTFLESSALICSYFTGQFYDGANAMNGMSTRSAHFHLVGKQPVANAELQTFRNISGASVTAIFIISAVIANLARVDSSSPLCWSQAQEKREGWKPHFCKTTHTQNPQRNTTHRHQPRNSDLFKFFRGRTPGLIAWAVAMNKPELSIGGIFAPNFLIKLLTYADEFTTKTQYYTFALSVLMVETTSKLKLISCYDK
nr:unnamed protein product [Callosobruchus chinensis]